MWITPWLEADTEEGSLTGSLPFQPSLHVCVPSGSIHWGAFQHLLRLSCNKTGLFGLPSCSSSLVTGFQDCLWLKTWLLMCSGEVGTDVDSLFYLTTSKALFMEAMEWIWFVLQADKQVHVAYKLSVVGKLKDCSLLIQERRLSDVFQKLSCDGIPPIQVMNGLMSSLLLNLQERKVEMEHHCSCSPGSKR